MATRRRNTVTRRNAGYSPWPIFTRKVYHAYASMNEASTKLASALTEMEDVVDSLGHYAHDTKSRRLLTRAKKTAKEARKVFQALEDARYTCLDTAEHAATIAGYDD